MERCARIIRTVRRFTIARCGDWIGRPVTGALVTEPEQVHLLGGVTMH